MSGDVLDRIARLPPEKRAQLQELLAQKTRQGPEVEPSSPEPAGEPVPSFGQERLWFLHQMAPASAAYNVPAAVALDGHLSAAALAGAVARVVGRHEALSTVFEATADGPRPRLLPFRPTPLPVADLSGIAEPERRRRLDLLLDREALRPFDLATGPLWRSGLIRLGATSHAACFTQHHAASDGWSMGIFIGEMSETYGASVAGRPAALPSPARYGDFARAERRRWEGPELDDRLSFWADRLAGVPVLELPADRPRPTGGGAGGRGGRVRLAVPVGDLEATDRLARQERATRFIVLLAAYQALLARLTGQEDFAVGTPVASRPRGAEEVIGYFVDSVAIRADVSGDPSFRELLARARGTALEAFELQDLPFERLVSHLLPKREPAVPPLFQAMLVLQNLPPARAELPGLVLEVLERDVVAAKLDLTLAFAEKEGALAGALDYAAELFEPATAERIARAFETLLADAVARPDVPVSQLALPADAPVRRPAPGVSAAPAERATARATRAPSTPTERLVAAAWRQVLGTPPAGIDDDFFEHGGHSLAATRLAFRLQEELGREVPVREVFERPTVARLSAFLDGATNGAGQSGLPPLTPRTDPGPAPLSFSQERLWFLDRLELGSTVYNVPGGVRMRGVPSAGALAGAVWETVRRHSALASVVVEGPDGPRQEARPLAPGPLPWVDLTRLTEDDRRRLADRLTTEDEARPFDLASGPLCRGRLVRLGPDDHLGLFTQHHFVSDAWSMSLFLQELSALYGAYRAGWPSPLPEPRLTYADYAAWQRSALGGETFDLRLDRRGERFTGIADLELPTDRPRPPVASRRGAQVAERLAPEQVARLEALAREAGASPFMVLLTAYEALLARLTGQTAFAVGTPVANRQPATEGVVGFFVNTVVLPADLAGDPSFEELLARAREAALDAFAEQDLPFERLVERLRPERDLASSPLFQAMLSLQNAPPPRLSLPGLELAPLVRETGTSKFDLTLNLAPDGGALTGRWVFARDLFDRTTVGRWARSFRGLLAAALERPETALSALPVMAPAEHHQVLLEWRGAAAPREEGSLLLHRRIAEVAERVADRVALTTDHGLALTYGELLRRARGLAGVLREAGVRPGDGVPVVAPRSAETVVAFLGVLSAGGFYVPVDPEYPEGRVAFLLGDLQESARGELVVVAPPAWQERLGGLGRLVGWTEWTKWTGWTEEKDTAAGPAYGIYTSGSSGRPKAVVVGHGAITPRLLAARLEGMGSSERVLHKASPSFDVSVFEIFAPLLLGARIHVVSPGSTADLTGLLTVMREQETTHVSFPPSLLSSLLGPDGLVGCPALRRVMTGGETVPADLPGRFERALPIPLFNRYGPTEATISVTEHRLTRQPQPHGPLPIGRPIHGARVVVADRFLEPVPVGVAGEILLGGPSLALGYLGRPERTAAAFVPDAVSGEAGERLYRTGDLGRWRPDGALTFLGRGDGQVKVRGHRVELGEVEAVLSAHPAVAEAAVVDRPDPVTGSRRLVAWIVPAEGTAAHLDTVRRAAATRLPAWAVPAEWGVLEALPTTPNGKVDRQALVVLEPADSETAGHLPPRNPTEELVAGAFAQVLGRDRVGVHDDFFDLGGHSLLATRVVSRLRDAFGRELPLRTLFEAPTVAELAAVLDDLGRGEAETVPLIRGEEGPAPLSFAQERFWFLQQFDPDSSVYVIPATFGLDGPLSHPALAQGLGEVVRRHEVLRSVVTRRGEEPVQEAVAVTLRVAVVDLAGLPAERRQSEADRFSASHARRGFDLERPPHLRASLLRLAPGQRTALFATHHVVADGWSVGVLVRELSSLYGAFAGGAPSPLPELPIRYADFARWQRRWLTGETLEHGVGFFRGRLSGFPEALELPTDRPRPAVTSPRGAALSATLPTPLADRLEAHARSRGVTPFMVLLSALSTLLARWTRQDRLVVGTPVAGRERTETEGLIGLFLNTLPLPVDLAPDPPFEGLCRAVRETTLGAFAHQTVPFEKLVEELSPERSLSRTPLFQVQLVLQNLEEAALDLGGARLTPRPMAQAETKLDLTLTAARRPEGLRLTAAYRTDLFDAATVRRFLGQLHLLLDAAVEDPARPVSELPLLSPAARHQVVVEWNDTAAELPAGCLHELFLAQAERTPEAPAAACAGRTLTYAELLGRSRALASELAARGVGPETVVALVLDRSLELPVAMLATLMAGGAYLPMDPIFPAERIAGLVEDSGARWVLTREALAPRLANLAGVEVIAVDAPTEMLLAGAAARTADPRWPAYVIYTSGSTGRPKGVVLEHRQVARYLASYTRATGWRPGLSFAMVQSPSVDAPVTNVWLTLTTGGCLHLLPPEMASDPPAVEAYFREHRIEALKLAPSHLKALQTGPRPADVVPTEFLFLGGESVHTRYLSRLHERSPGTLVFGNYGPTEAAVSMLLSPLDPRRMGDEPAVFPLGRPIPGTGVLLLDDRGQPVPPGAPGEIHITGFGLARGYLGRPGLTASVFLPHPASPVPGERRYATGDLARFLPDGRLEFLGRADHQVKIRGFRIEPGEVEAVLQGLPGIAEAVVLARQDGGETMLVGYVVADAGVDANPAALEADVQERLRKVLPPYMVPAAVVPLPELPRTPHGKLDRKALPEPGPRRPGAAYVAPANAMEETLARLWSEVLGVERVGVHDDFFALGGHSLKAIQLVSRIRQELAVELPLRRFFEATTVAGLAAELWRAQTEGDDAAELERMLAEIGELSDEEAEALLETEDVAEEVS